MGHSKSFIEPGGEPAASREASTFAEVDGLPWWFSSLPLTILDLPDLDLMLTPIGKGSCRRRSSKYVKYSNKNPVPRK